MNGAYVQSIVKEVLNNIMDNSNFSTCHISSFIN